jgi:hypothetical protein
MVRKELIRRSPLRILEKSTHGGLGKGNLGVVAARKGIGKTACLVHIATDSLFQGRQVIHASFAADTSHIVSWYDDIFAEISGRFRLDAAIQVRDEIIRRRIIMNFNQDGIQLPRVVQSIRAMIRDGAFSADTLIVDGYDFARVTREELAQVRSFAREFGLEAWFSVSLKDERSIYDPRGVPTLLVGLLDEIDVLVCLRPIEAQTQTPGPNAAGAAHIRLQLIKDHDRLVTGDLHLNLDPHTLLILPED